MNIFLILSGVAVSLVITINLVGAWLLARNKDIPQAEEEVLPGVAILIAARNEAATLKRCLQALEQLHYPPDLLTVWVGDDNSEDATGEIARKICSAHSGWHVLEIKEAEGEVKGKANVLAQLARAAGPFADFFFITDADIAVVPEWIREMLKYFSPEVAIVNGTTVVEGGSWFSSCQRYDWALALGLAKAYTLLPRLGKTITAIGNNMAVRKSAYEAVGGYENIPFSITEDYELHRQVTRRGFQTYHASVAGTKAYTLPATGLKELLHQRKRWMTGAMQLPLPMVAMLLIQALFFPCILLVLFWFPLAGGVLYLIKLLSQFLLVRQSLMRLSESPGFPFCGYELYSFLLSISMLLFYVLPVKISWKGRKY